MTVRRSLDDRRKFFYEFLSCFDILFLTKPLNSSDELFAGRGQLSLPLCRRTYNGKRSASFTRQTINDQRRTVRFDFKCEFRWHKTLQILLHLKWTSALSC
jgi:hypothetical protein